MQQVQFVVGWPKNQTQRQQSLSIIQANAARWRWRKERATARLRCTEARRNRLNSSYASTDERRLAASRQTNQRDISPEAKLSEALHAPYLLFQRNLDTRALPPILPVQYAELIKGSDLQFMLQQCHDKWLDVFPLDIYECIKAADSWMTLMINSKAVFEAFAFSHFQRLNALEPSARTLRLSLEWYTKNVETVNAIIRGPTRTMGDDIIFAVWTLWLHAPLLEPQPIAGEDVRRPSQGPLKSLHMINYVGGAMRFVPVHRLGFLKLLELRGGLQGLNIGAAKYMFSLAEIYFSTQTLCRPQMEFVSSMSLDLPFSLATNRRTDHPLSRMGFGFKAMENLSSSRFCEHVRAALDNLALYSLGVDDFSAGRRSSKHLAVLAQERAFVQHEFVSLYPDQDRTDEEACGESGLRACYLAGMIYTLLIVMPIPRAPFSALVRQLKKELRVMDCADHWEEAPQLMTWVIVMYAIAAIGMSERAWAVAALERCFRRLNIDSWDGFQDLVSEFLWLPITNDIDGMDLWDEIEQSNPLDGSKLMLEYG